MLRYVADENFNGDIVRGLVRRNPSLDIVRVQDIGLSGADDPTVLAWAASQGCVVVTQLAECRLEGEWEGRVLYVPLAELTRRA